MGHIRSEKLLRLKANSNCWICEGWTEFRFDFKPPNGDEIDNDTMPVNLHISCDGYQGELLERDTAAEEVTYSTCRMLPPGEVTYYYTINGEITLKGDAQLVDSHIALKGPKLLRLQVPRTNVIENVVQN